MSQLWENITSLGLSPPGMCVGGVSRGCLKRDAIISDQQWNASVSLLNVLYFSFTCWYL